MLAEHQHAPAASKGERAAGGPEPSPRPETLVCIGICTAGRPRLLSKCLASLVRQPAPAGHRYALIIVDNEAEPKAQPIVQAAAVHSQHDLRHVHEPRRGISFARNRALEEALAAGADWVGFIDDDETASSSWLESLLDAAARYEADVIQGPVEPRYPEPMPYWALPAAAEHAEGEGMKFAATGNVLFRAALIRPDGMGLRFDEAMSLSGGEDTDFFLRARQAGARIVYSGEPVVYEEVAPGRLSFRRHMSAAFRNGANDVYIKRKLYGGIRIFLRRLPQILLRLLRGTVQLAASPLFAAFGQMPFKRRVLAGGRQIFKSLGVLAGLTGFRPRPYRKIDGY
ncbi:MAG: glycosyltransferase [Rhodomicrobium sp.]|nr:glycosyltransferase [Rhodomicrobium sp.]